ncbi:hypothetical protein K1719_046733 [Acacia pycnantha]|nr:hypothetical protein K1719_046733 [Acacia pycnantha]
MRKVINFQSLLADCNLMDLEFKGSRFTWCNKRTRTTVRERLDRALGNMEFRENFDHAMVFHIDPIGSHHHTLPIDASMKKKHSGHSSLRPFGYNMRIFRALKAIDLLRQRLTHCTSGVLTLEKLNEAEVLTRQIEDVWAKEESYWWQRLRISWLTCGDKNTKFFHNSVLQRRQRNKVLHLNNEVVSGWREETT